MDAADSAPSITCAEFLHFWAVHMEYALDKTAKFWRALRQPGATAILRSDLEEVVQAIVDYHPDLQDLRENEQLRAWCVPPARRARAARQASRAWRRAVPGT